MNLDPSFTQAYLFDSLQKIMKAEGFSPLPSKKQFRKEEEKGFQSVILAVSGYEDLMMIEFHYGLRLQAVEDLVGRFTRSLTGWKADAHSAILSQGKLWDRPYWRFEAKDSDELDRVMDQFKEMWEEKARQFLEDHFSLKGLHELLNADPYHPSKYLPNQGHRYLRGLAVAHLVQDKDFENLAKIYREKMDKEAGGELLKPGFERLLQYLQHLNWN